MPLQCHECSYDLTGLDDSGVCPECATSVAASRRAAEEAARHPAAIATARWSQSISVIGALGAAGAVLVLAEVEGLAALIFLAALLGFVVSPFAALWVLSWTHRKRRAVSICLLVANVVLVTTYAAAFGSVFSSTSSTAALGVIAMPCYGLAIAGVTTAVVLGILNRYP